jgi:hypothetical protein
VRSERRQAGRKWRRKPLKSHETRKEMAPGWRTQKGGKQEKSNDRSAERERQR